MTTAKRVDRVDGAVLVEFSDGTTVVYGADFLLQHREDQGNRVIPEPEAGDAAA
jgi:hypothetical protein